MTDASKIDTRSAPGHQPEAAAPVIHSPTDVSGYRMLTGQEVALVNRVKAKGEEIKAILEEALDAGADPRNVAASKTHFEDGFMRLTRSITKPTTFA